MTNHIHMIAQAEEGNKLSDILRDFKKHTSKEIIKSIQEEGESRREWMLNIFKTAAEKSVYNEEYKFWKHSNHPFLLYSVHMINQKLNYIHDNPVRAGLVKEQHEYLYSSACNRDGAEFILPVLEM